MIQNKLNNTLQIYLVGGAVRDQLLSMPTQDRDWVVVGATPDNMLAQGFVQVGQDFPVFLHPESKEEYALARQEHKTGPGYQGFEFDINRSVTLEQDLERRDLTINAMAQDTQGQLYDPFHGTKDLEAKILRHVSPAFIEDPLRVLRVARFHARYAHLGFSIAPETLELMKKLSQNNELHNLTAERIWLETQKALGEKNPEIYFKTLHKVQALNIIFPEIAALDGVPQSKQYHPEVDTFVHVMQCLAASAHLTDNLSIRFAVLLHDIGKGITPKALWPKHIGHESAGIPLVKAVCTRLKVNKTDQDLALKVCAEHLHFHRCFEMRPITLLRLLKRLDVFRQPKILDQWLTACEADRKGRGENEQVWRQALTEVLPNIQFIKDIYTAAASVTFQMLPEGLSGAAIGKALDTKRQNAIAQVIKAWSKKSLS